MNDNELARCEREFSDIVEFTSGNAANNHAAYLLVMWEMDWIRERDELLREKMTKG